MRVDFRHAKQKMAFDQLLARAKRLVNKQHITGVVVDAVIEEEGRKNRVIILKYVIRIWPVSQKITGTRATPAAETILDVRGCHSTKLPSPFSTL